ncbi:coiled-coil domain-containing protein ASCRUDRAFT_76651 [Ascoidea rubescens DSM 1968]|uniref:SWI5-dependent HO expression protein 3 n=1 Tax=Ascoidea rubescens DSM 1968 TaxID=1344418 RepID=A0A1D2VEY6_9ASCO|nr:hypothetical protein ASCRUDRAFT_76651 [Ascoidea rubescens DSM 1968]ODV60142.1 hypothetical protein ASCRUDRAFT_76651 [Ascoidea rubescens DSM 1968]
MEEFLLCLSLMLLLFIAREAKIRNDNKLKYDILQDDFKQTNESSIEKVKSIEEKCLKLSDDIKKNNEIIAIKNSNIISLMSDINNLQSEVNKLNSKLILKDQELNKNLEKIKRINEENNAKDVIINQSSKKLEELEKKISIDNDQFKTLKIDKNNLVFNYNKINSQNNNLLQTNSNLIKDYDTLNFNFKKLLNKHKELKFTISSFLPTIKLFKKEYSYHLINFQKDYKNLKILLFKNQLLWSNKLSTSNTINNDDKKSFKKDQLKFKEEIDKRELKLKNLKEKFDIQYNELQIDDLNDKIKQSSLVSEDLIPEHEKGEFVIKKLHRTGSVPLTNLEKGSERGLENHLENDLLNDSFNYNESLDNNDNNDVNNVNVNVNDKTKSTIPNTLNARSSAPLIESNKDINPIPDLLNNNNINNPTNINNPNHINNPDINPDNNPDENLDDNLNNNNEEEKLLEGTYEPSLKLFHSNEKPLNENTNVIDNDNQPTKNINNTQNQNNISDTTQNENIQPNSNKKSFAKLKINPAINRQKSSHRRHRPIIKTTAPSEEGRRELVVSPSDNMNSPAANDNDDTIISPTTFTALKLGHKKSLSGF